MSKGIGEPRRIGQKGATATGTIEAHLAVMRRNNRKPTGYDPTGTPGDAFCKPGQYDKMTRGRYYNAKSGPDRWDAKRGPVY